MKYIIGVDEVGLGAWAGPLFVCAVAVPTDWAGPPGLNDSKEKTKPEMAELYHHLQHLPMALMGMSNETIDSMGIRPALVAAHVAAAEQLLARFPGARIIVDGDVRLPALPQAEIIAKADAKFPAVMAASIVAKVNRDFLMKQYHQQYPHYGWDTNAGYGGNAKHAHTAGLDAHGVTPLHRKSYAPIRKRLLAQRQMNLFGGT